MDLISFSQMLTVTIEGFAALLAISIALFIFLYERYWTRINEVRGRIDSNLNNIEELFNQLDPGFVFEFPYWERGHIEWGKHVTFRRMIAELAKDYEEVLDKEVELTYGKRRARRELTERAREAEMDMSLLEQVMALPYIPGRLLLYLLPACVLPILYALSNLLMMTYNLPIAWWSGYLLFAVDVGCIGFMCFTVVRYFM